MGKWKASIMKELIQLISDRLGLIMLFVLPVLLVFIITIIQDSAYRIVNENNISLIVSNQDKGEIGDRLMSSLGESRMFSIEEVDLNEAELKEDLLNSDHLIAVYIPEDFSTQLQTKSQLMSEKVMVELGVFEESTIKDNGKPLQLNMIYDPILQQNYCASIAGIMSSHLAILENELMIESIFSQMETPVPDGFEDELKASQTIVNQVPASSGKVKMNPNSTQHNVPAWTLFAMFFMVITLGGNIVKERSSGAYTRLKLLSGRMHAVFGAKVIVFLLVAFFQVLLIFTIGKLVFPLIGLPDLQLPSNIIGLFFMILVSGLAAVAFAMMIGTVTSSQVQAHGLGAVLVVIFAAIGGIWVPIFVMPEAMQNVAMLSPLYWCLQGFYELFLHGGEWSNLGHIFLVLFGFIGCCFLVTYLKLKRERLF